jgi:DNA invertase Pin-like site-specific DNA recombinase
VRKRLNTSGRVLAYLRVSTEEQGVSGLGIGAQRASLQAEALRRGWDEVVYVVDQGYSAKTLDRPALAAALDDLAAGRAGLLVVAKVDRLSRSTLNFLELMARAAAEGWKIVALDCGVDMTTPQGELMVTTMAAFAQFERRMIAQRTRDAMAVRRAQGRPISRPTVAADVAARIVAMREEGMTLQAIADVFNDEGLPTARGAPHWRPSVIRSALGRALVAA